MAFYKINGGLDLKMAGQPLQEKVQAKPVKTVGISPLDFHGINPKMLVKEENPVQIGTPIFYDKLNPKVKFVSPGGGKVKEIIRGKRRVILEVVIELDEEEAAVEFQKNTLKEISDLSRESIINQINDGGLWPLLKQRPYWKIAHPDKEPAAIVVSGFNLDPILGDYNYFLEGQEENIKAGFEALKVLAPSKVHYTVPAFGKEAETPLAKLTPEGISVHSISGLHPAGSAEVQLYYIRPYIKGEVCWTLDIVSLARIGQLLLEGKFPEKTIASVGGSAAEAPKYIRTRVGAPVSSLIDGQLNGGEVRIISGSVLSGKKVGQDNYLGFFDNGLTLIGEGNKPRFLGWVTPGFKTFSFYRAFASSFFPRKNYNYDTNINGSLRAILPIGSHEKVCPVEVMPHFLVRSILANDIEEMEQLGLTDCSECGLCTYVDPSKMEYGEILRDGLDTLEREG